VLSLALIGPLGVGKTTVANILVEHRGYTRIPFAGAVKQDCADMLDFVVQRHKQRSGWNTIPGSITKDTIEQFKKDVFGPLLQWYGTDFWRNFMDEPEHWIARWVQEVKQVEGPVVVDDCRFLNEAEALSKMNFSIVRLFRPSAFERDARSVEHASETEQKDIPVHETWMLKSAEPNELTTIILNLHDELVQRRSDYAHPSQETIKVL
jgi:hypothetical protein